MGCPSNFALAAAGASARAGDYEGRVTIKVVTACIIAATGGMLFGYDLGVTGRPYTLCPEDQILPAPVLACCVNCLPLFLPAHFSVPLLCSTFSRCFAGGVSSFPVFLDDFFPEVLGGRSSNAYCTYNSQKLQNVYILLLSGWYAQFALHRAVTRLHVMYFLQLARIPQMAEDLTALQHDPDSFDCIELLAKVFKTYSCIILCQPGTPVIQRAICILRRMRQHVYSKADWKTQLRLLCFRCCCRVGVSLVECKTWTQMVYGYCWSLVFHWCCHQCRNSGPGHAVPWPYLSWFWCWLCQPVGMTQTQPALELDSALFAQSTGSVLPNPLAHQGLVHQSFLVVMMQMMMPKYCVQSCDAKGSAKLLGAKLTWWLLWCRCLCICQRLPLLDGEVPSICSSSASASVVSLQQPASTTVQSGRTGDGDCPWDWRLSLPWSWDWVHFSFQTPPTHLSSVARLSRAAKCWRATEVGHISRHTCKTVSAVSIPNVIHCTLLCPHTSNMCTKSHT